MTGTLINKLVWSKIFENCIAFRLWNDYFTLYLFILYWDSRIHGGQNKVILTDNFTTGAETRENVLREQDLFWGTLECNNANMNETFHFNIELQNECR